MVHTEQHIEGQMFRYRLDFYYQQAILYCYAHPVTSLRGTIAWNRAAVPRWDPVLYIIIVFVLISFTVLTLIQDPGPQTHRRGR